MKKIIIAVVLAIVLAIFSFLIIKSSFVGHNDVQNFQIKQSMSGNVEIISKGGFYFKFFPTIWTYPKVRNTYFSRDKRESSAVDESIEVRFKNKGIGFLSTRVTYRLFGSADAISAMHENCRGDIEIADGIVLAKLKEAARIRGSELTSSEAVEKQEGFIEDVRKNIIGNKELSDIGIVIEKIEMTGIDFDDDTLNLFKSQQRAILLGEEANANKIKYDMQLKETDAKYRQQIAEEKGKAEMLKMKAVTDAEREAELARIDAERKVTVAELDRKEAVVRQEKLKDLAEIDKQAALIKASQLKEVSEVELQQAKLDAQSKIELALAKQKEVELSGAITERERTLAEIAANKDVAMADAIAKSIRGLELPKTVIVGGENGNSSSQLFNMWLMKQVDSTSKK